MRAGLLLPLACALLQAQPKVDLTKPPETPPIPSYKLPPVHSAKLANGLQVMLVEDKRFPLVTARIVFHAGSKFDPQDLPGLADAMSALITEGTKTRTQLQIAEETTSIGGSINGSASADAVTIAGSSLSEFFPKLMNLLADVTLNATFPQEEVQLYKENRKQALLAQKTQPAFLANEQFQKTVYGEGSPYAHIAPTPEAIDKLDVKGLTAFRDSHLTPANANLILLGDLPARAETMKVIESHFGKWQQKAAPPAPKMQFPASKREIILVDRPGSVQADIRVGQLSVTRKDQAHFPLLMGNIILGGGMMSRLFSEIREKQGFAYDVHTEFDRNREMGTTEVVTQVRNEVLEPALGGVLKEMEGMGQGPVTATELTDAKNYVAGNFLLGMQTQAGLAGQLAMAKEMDLPVSYLENFTNAVRATEPDQIQNAAKKFIAPEDAVIVVVGDVSKIQAAVEKYGTVRVVKP